MTISIIIAVVFAIILLLLFSGKKNKSASASTNTSTSASKGEDKRVDVVNQKNVKLLSYKEALEASKQFIYNITRAVIQRFTPGSQQELLNVGKRLLSSGMEYLHVVDIFALSVEKQKTRAKSTSKTPEREQGGRGK